MKPARALWLLSYLLFSAASVQAASTVVSPVPSPAPAPVSASASAPSPELFPAAQEKEVAIKADTITIDVPSDSYRAQGSVRVVQDGVSLLADSVIYNRLSGNSLAQGHVLVEKGIDTLKGDQLSLNMISQQGELSNGELFVKKSNFWIRGKRVEKTGPDDYRVEQGSFTTCDGDKPSWRFEAKDVKITLDEFATAHDAVFYVGDLPLLYTPYLIFPVMRERQSGLLIPRLGHTSKKGFYYDQPYYWAIDPSQDATFDLDLESSRGVGVGVDYRYLRPHGSEGRVNMFGIYDTRADKFRGELNLKQIELLSPDLTLAADLHAITDRSYYKDYGEFSGDYNRQLHESTISFDRRWERYGLSGDLRYVEDLVAANNKSTLQRLPEFSFLAAGEKIGPLFFSMDSGFSNFERIEGVIGQRVELHPRLAFYQKQGGVDLALYGGYRQRFYNSNGSGAPGEAQQVGQADAGANLSLPLERIYDGRVRHLLIPSLEYHFVQQKRDSDTPFFDYGDRILGESAVRWSVSSVVTQKITQEGAAPEFRDLLYLKLSQGYQISGRHRELLTLANEGRRLSEVINANLLNPLQGNSLVDEPHRVTDLLLEGKLTPAKGVTFAMDSRVNPVDGYLSTANAAVEVKGEGTNPNLALVGYRYSRGELDYLEGRFAVPLSSQFTASVLGRYSFDKGGFLESRYSLEYKRQCWSVIASYADRLATRQIPGNTEFSLNFTLAGLGAMGPVRAF